MTQVSEDDLVNWRALVRRIARGYDEIFQAMSDDEAARSDYPDTAAELNHLGDWLDTLTGVAMGKAVNGQGRVSL